MQYIVSDGKTQVVKTLETHISNKTRAMMSMPISYRLDMQQEFIEESNSMDWDKEDEICIICGEKTLTYSRYCMSCRKALIEKYQRLIRKEFTPAEIQFLDEQVEFFGINADLNKED